MNEQLQALFSQHKNVVLGVAAAGVAGLALLKRKQATGTGTAAATKSPAGTIPAAGVVPSSGVQGTFPDTTESNVYNSVMDRLLQQQAAMTSAGGDTPLGAPAPVASTLLAPTYSGNYFGMGSGIGEIETDGSLFVFTQPQWQNALKQNPNAGSQLTDFGSKNVPGLKFFSTIDNVKAKSTSPTPAP